MTRYRRIAIVGVGLIGGSIGCAVKKRRLADEVVGIGRRESSLQIARDVGAVDQGTTDLSAGVANAEFVVVATPVAALADSICDVATICPQNCLITDAGSTKAQLIAEVQQRRANCDRPPFIGSHPMAGDHVTGPAHARSDLFEGRTVVVTPTAASAEEDVKQVSEFWQALGAKVLRMSPAEHDESVATTSHLPHMVAFALARATPESMGPLAASGWRDTTRVAAADPALWQQIFATNDVAVLAALDRFEASLAELRNALAQQDEARLFELLKQAKQSRDVVGS